MLDVYPRMIDTPSPSLNDGMTVTKVWWSAGFNYLRRKGKIINLGNSYVKIIRLVK